MQEKYGLFYGGAFHPAEGNAGTENRNPATGEPIARVAAGTASDVDAAVRAASGAFGAWRHLGPVDRAAVLSRIADAVDAHRQELGEIETRDTGRPIAETLFDVDAFSDLMRYFAGVVRSDEESMLRHSQTEVSLIRREPLGVVGLIIPWNYPFSTLGWKLAPALAAGNAVVAKPASLTPMTALRLCELTQDILPAGVLNVVTGSGSVCGEALITHPGIAKLSFTGSTAVGRRVAAAAAARTVPVTLELGGKSANIVFPDADMSRAVEAAAMAIMMSQGQVCSAGSRLLLHRDVAREFLESLRTVLGGIKIGDPLDPETRMGPMASKEQFDAVMAYIETGKAEGATLFCGGRPASFVGGSASTRGRTSAGVGHFIEPTVFTDTRPDMRIVQEEIFGPVLVVQEYADEAEAVALANDSVYGLAGAVWTKDINRALRVAAAIETGTVWINDYHPVPSGSPFGGIKESGYGREVHKSALDAYSSLKTVYINSSDEPYGWYR
jgi:aldehyde dehydrogenase (NAD+)